MEQNKPREGLYFDLDEALYHADPALGSSSMKQLAWSPCDYWFGSVHNPNRDAKKETDAQIEGRAYHKLVLEGRDALEFDFQCRQVENWTTKEGRAEKEDFEARGVKGLKFDTWSRILMAGASISANPHLREAFRGGPAEVSIFWEKDGVRRKARIDCLKIRANSDLKTITPDDGIPFDEACIRAMGRYHYHVQAEHYNEGRAQIGRFLNEEKIYGSHNRRFLEDVAERKSWASVFVFLKKAEAPLSWGTSITLPLEGSNPLLEAARATIDKASANYRAYRDEFGMDTPWMATTPLRELDITDLPPWFRTL